MLRRRHGDASLGGGLPHLDFSHLNEMWWNRKEETIPAFHDQVPVPRPAAADDWDRVAVITHWGSSDR